MIVRSLSSVLASSPGRPSAEEFPPLTVPGVRECASPSVVRGRPPRGPRASGARGRLHDHGARFACALALALVACGGEPTEPPPAEPSAPPPADPTEPAEPPTTAEIADAPETEVAGDSGVAVASAPADDAGPLDGGAREIAATAPEFEIPPYASAAPACQPREPATDEAAPSLADVARGGVDFPMAANINPACEHDAADVANALNRGGLRRHRQREYAQSSHYFAQALVADPSQLSPRFNLACARARELDTEGLLTQLRELRRAGSEGGLYAARALRDRDFGDYHGTPFLNEFYADPPAALTAIAGGETRDAESVWDESTIELSRGFIVLGERTWEPGVLTAEEFQGVVLALEPDRRRFHFFNERPSEAGAAALATLGLRPLARMTGWTPEEGRSYALVPTASRDEVRNTLYIARVISEERIREVATIDLAAPSCPDGVEGLAAFVSDPDHRVVGYVRGCLDQPPETFERCLFFDGGSILRRTCGHGEAPAAPAAADAADAGPEEPALPAE